MDMNWTLIVICTLAILVGLKFIKTIGKLVFTIILIVAVCGVLIGTYGVNPIEWIGGYLGVF